MQVFRADGERFGFYRDNAYACMRGYFLGLKACLGGLFVNCDMSVSCFLAGGSMIDLMGLAGGFRSPEDFIKECNGRGLSPQVMDKINTAVKNCKVKLTHLGRMAKVKCLGPCSNNNKSLFDCNGTMITVAKYYSDMSKKKDKSKAYKTLKYPALPTVNIGSTKRPVWVPVELVEVPGGQVRSKVMTGDMTATMIK